MRFIVAALALGLAGSAGWAAFHFVVAFFWPEAGPYAAFFAAAFYVLGFMPKLRPNLRLVLTGFLYFTLGYAACALFSDGTSLIGLERMVSAAVYFFVLRYPVDRSLDRGLTKVIAQIRNEAPELIGFMVKSLGALVFGMCAIYIAYRYDKMFPDTKGPLGLLPSASLLIMAFVVFFSAAFVIAAICSLLTLLIPRADYQPRTTPKPQDIFTTGRPATLGQLDTAARGGSASNVRPLRFKD